MDLTEQLDSFQLPRDPPDASLSNEEHAHLLEPSLSDEQFFRINQEHLQFCVLRNPSA